MDTGGEGWGIISDTSLWLLHCSWTLNLLHFESMFLIWIVVVRRKGGHLVDWVQTAVWPPMFSHLTASPVDTAVLLCYGGPENYGN